MNSPPLAITMGDPAGVGPEICLRLLAGPPPDTNPVIYGDLHLLQRVAATTGLPTPDPARVHHINSLTATVLPGKIQASCGRAAYTYLTTAIDHALAGTVAAIVTAPLNKASLHAAGIAFPGHTEILAHHTGSGRYCMMQVSEPVTASFVTCHCGYTGVPKLLTTGRITEVVDLTVAALAKTK
ncbi:MAG: 4-hydroxythreonine-4-phosphate dehydrogenase PdxA, partial [Verrucomicrobiales bacterium]|nr:4-hydroxythreonine-4-phosphate dehydrogenase PdxA [Verrucomicrobiales bacterium]